MHITDVHNIVFELVLNKNKVLKNLKGFLTSRMVQSLILHVQSAYHIVLDIWKYVSCMYPWCVWLFLCEKSIEVEHCFHLPPPILP